MDNTSKVYVLTDDLGRIISIDGGYTIANITDIENWILIDEGEGDRYNLCQSHYLPKPVMDDRGISRYKLVRGKVVERTRAEMDADYIEPTSTPTADERIAELEAQNEMLLECLLEISEIIYA